MRRLMAILGCLVVTASSGYAGSTRLYFRVNAGVRSLSTTVPSESAVCGSSTGCVTVATGDDLACNVQRQTLSGPSIQFKYILTEALVLDGSANETSFQYWAGASVGSFTQPTMQVTYKYNEAVPPADYVETMGVPCPCGQVTNGCPMNSPVTYTLFDKDVGANISTVDVSTSGTPRTNLPAGSTVYVDIWIADGSAGKLLSSAANPSYIVLPYAKDTLAVYGSIEAQHAEARRPGTFTYTLFNTHAGAQPISQLIVKIPGAIQGTTFFFGSVQIVSVMSGGFPKASTTTVIQSTSSSQGTITVDFGGPNLLANEVVTVSFTASAPGKALQTLKWDADVSGPFGSINVVDKVVDSRYMAVLDRPPAPTGLTTIPLNTASGGGQLRVGWNLVGNVEVNAITAYRIYRGTTALVATVRASPPNDGFASWRPATGIYVTAVGLSYTDVGLTNGQLFCYSVEGVNPVGGGPFSAVVCGTPYADPAAPISLSVSVSAGAVVVAWMPSVAGTYSLAGYDIFRSTCTTCASVLYLTGASTTMASLGESGLANSSTTTVDSVRYAYQVRAFDSLGHRGGFSPAISGIPAVNPPGVPGATYDYSLSAVTLQWAPSTGDIFSISGYRIYRATCGTCGLSQVSLGGPAATVYIDASVAVAKQYYYGMTTLSDEGGSGATEGGMTALQRIVVPPAVPVGLTVLPAGGANLYLEWSFAGVGAANGYYIYRATAANMPVGSAYATVALGMTTTTYSDTGSAFGQRYYYQVQAFLNDLPNPTVKSPVSPSVFGVVRPDAPQGLVGVANDAIVRLRWTDLRPGQEVLTYNIYRSTISAASGSIFVASVSATYFDDVFVTNALTYFYSVNATNLGGSGAYAATTGLTPYIPPGMPGPLVATSGIFKVDLGWGASAVTSYPIAGYWIFRGTYAGGEGVTPINPGGVLITTTYYADTGLGNGTTYFYIVQAQDSALHVSALSAEASATPAIPPCAPATLTAQAGNAQVRLQWALVSATACSPAPSTLPVSGYRIYRSTVSMTVSSALFAPVGSVGFSTTSAYTDATVVNGTTYYYAVRTFDTGSPPNETIDIFTYALVYSPQATGTPRIPAAAPVGLTVQGEPNEHDTMLKLYWSPSVPGSLPIEGYNLYRSTRVGGPDTRFYLPGAATAAYLDVGLVNNKFYYYRVAPVETGGFEGLWAAVSGTPFADPNPPTGVTVKEGDTLAIIQWVPPVPTTYPVTAYRVSRATYPGIVSLPVISGPGIDPFYGTVFTDTGRTNGTTYFYHVQTYDNKLHLSHAYSAEVSGTPYAVPLAPLGLTLASGDQRITVSWSAAVPGTYPVSGYTVYRAPVTGAACPGVVVATITGGLLQFVDAGMLNDGSFYFYKVAAFDVVSPAHLSACSGEQSASPFATVDPPGKPNNLTALATASQIALAWQAGSPSPPRSISGYTIFRTTYAVNPATPVEFLGDTVSGTTLSYTDASVVNGTVYYYRVRTRDDAYTLNLTATSYSQSSNETVGFPAETPSGLVATALVNAIGLAWNAVAIPAGNLPVTGYAIYRATGSAGPYVFLSNTGYAETDVSFTDTAVSSGLAAFYRVRARHQQGWVSELSASANATPLGPPSAPALAAAAGDKTVWLGWTVATGGLLPTTSYQIFRSTTATGPWGTLGTPQMAPTYTYTDTGAGVSNGTPYYYQVASLDSSPLPTASTYSNAVYTLPLGTPMSLSAVPYSNRVNLNWTPSANGTAGISGYFVYRLSPTEAEGIAGTAYGASATTFFDATALVGVAYTYRVKAYDRITPPTMTGLFSNTAAATPVTPPVSPAITTLTTSFQRIDLVWVPPSPAGGTFPISGYKLFRASAAGPAMLLAAFSTTLITTYADTGLTNGVLWNYSLVVFDNRVPPNDSIASNVKGGIPFDIPLPPFALTTQPGGSGKLVVQWSATATQTTFPILGYNLYRGTVANGESFFAPINVSLVAASYYTDTGLVNGTTYFYKIKSVDSQGHISTTSLEGAGTPFNPAPAPTGLSALPGNNIVMLTWSAAGAGTYPVSGYMVYRGPATNAETLFAGPIYATIYTDNTVVNGTPYFYKVTARDSQNGESALSTEAAATPQTTLVNPPQNVSYSVGGSGVTLVWSGTFAGSGPGSVVAEYVILRSTCSACGTSTSAYVAAGTFTFTDTLTGTGASITYAVRAVVTANVTESPDTPGRSVIYIANACSPPGAPGSLVAVAGNGAVSLAWTAAPSACSLLGYNIYRDLVLINVTPIANLAYIDSGLANGTTYSYRVTAVSAGGEGAPATAAATPAARSNEAYLVRNAVTPVRGGRVDIQYTLAADADVTVRVYTIAGLMVFEGKNPAMAAGPAIGVYNFAGTDGLPGWDGKAADGQYVASGVYVIEIVAGTFRKMLKVVVVK